MRFWIVIVAALLFAAHAAITPSDVFDAETTSVFADEEELLLVVIAHHPHSPPITRTLVLDGDMPSSPALPRVFRPPRGSFV